MKIKAKQLQVAQGKLIQGKSTGTGETAYTFPQSDGTTGQVLATDGSGVLSFSTVSGGSGGDKTFERKNVNFTAAIDHHYSIDSANQAIIVTLPALSTISASGKEVRFYFRNRVGTNNITINVANSSGNLIDDSASYVLSVEYESITLVANKTDSIWELI